jgi:hypothetical protein
MTAIQSMSQMPKNYRILNVGEVIQDKDDFLDPDGKWVRTERPGVRVDQYFANRYRREIAECQIVL